MRGERRLQCHGALRSQRGGIAVVHGGRSHQADADVPMGVVSNASGQIEAELARGGIGQVGEGSGVAMRCVIDSHVVGVAKPDPRIFDFAMPHFPGVARERMLYVGDSVKMDVGGARAAGLTPVLVDPHDDHAGADFERVRSIVEIVGWF